MKKISVVVPCYNAHNYISRCLQSIDDQTYVQDGIGKIEVILVDDASTDDGATLGLIMEYEKKNPDNVVVIACETNSGPATARNTALKYATGDYVSFVDADDIMDRTMLSRMYDVMKLHDVDVVECSYKTFSDMKEIPMGSLEKEYTKKYANGSEEETDQKNNSSYLLKVETSGDRGRLILNSFKTAVWGRLYKKSFLDENAIYFPENMVYGEDNFFSGLSMLMCRSYYRIEDSLYYYYSNANGIIQRTNDNERIHQLVNIMKLYINELDLRGFLDDDNLVGTLSGFASEFEWYMIYKYFMDPVSFVISRKFPDWREQVSYFGKELLSFFPEAYNNVYLNSDKRWADYVTLLREADNTLSISASRTS